MVNERKMGTGPDLDVSSERILQLSGRQKSLLSIELCYSANDLTSPELP